MKADDDDREPLHSASHTFWALLGLLFCGVACLVHPFLIIGCLFRRDFEGVAALGIQLIIAVVMFRAYLRADNSVWMTDDGIEFGDGPTRVPWRHVREAIPWLYGASGFNTLTFSDGTPDVRFIGGADAHERLARAKRRARAHR